MKFIEVHVRLNCFSILFKENLIIEEIQDGNTLFQLNVFEFTFKHFSKRTIKC